MSQRSSIAGARSLNEQDLYENLTYFKVPQTDIESIRSKLTFKIFDEYAKILKGMYSKAETSMTRRTSPQAGSDLPSSPPSKLG